jgi:hypothetical protein
MGLEVNMKKSRWLKKNGVWLVDEFRFLGMKYIPRKKLPLFNEAFVENL